MVDSVEKLIVEAVIIVAILSMRAFRSGLAGFLFFNAVSVRLFAFFS